MQDVRDEFNKDREILRKKSIEILEIISSISHIKSQLKTLARVEQVENRALGTENKVEELDQSKTMKNTKKA
jgi:hypothetical protein